MIIDGENEGGEALDLPVFEDGPTEDVEIELTEDDLGENLDDFDVGEGDPEEEPEEDQAESEAEAEAEPEVDAEPEDKPRRRDAQKRIAELARRAQEAERRAEELEARAMQEAELRQKSDLAMMAHYERSLRTQASVVKAKLLEAKSIGDSEKEVDLQTELMNLTNELRGVEDWKMQAEAAKKQTPAETKPAPEQKRDTAPVPTIEPTTADWIKRNTWFQPQAPDFDQEMHEEATIYARRIERRYRAEGREAEIGSVEYFTEIDRHMRTEFPDAFESVATPKKAPPPMSRKSPVAPVNRAPEGQAQKGSKTIRLTADQRRMAQQLAESGAIKKPNGGRMTPAEAERYYAVHLMKQNRR